MLEIQRSKEIAGTITLPPNPDFLLLSLFIALTVNRHTRITPVDDTPLITQYKNLLSEHLAISQTEAYCEVNPLSEKGPSFILLPSGEIPYRDFIVFLLLGLKKTVGFNKLSPNRFSLWQQKASQFGCELEKDQREDAVAISLTPNSIFEVPGDILDPNSVHPCIGLSLGMKKHLTFSINHQFQSPLRHILSAFGYEPVIKSTYEKKSSNPLQKRMRFMVPKSKSKSDSKLSFTISIDFTDPPSEINAITLPGDDILASLLIAAKSLVQKGQFFLGNVPLEPWNSATLNYIRKMGCNPGIQEEQQTSFGSTGIISLQKFKLIGHKMDCRPLYHYQRQLPAMVVLATFAQGQSIFRSLEELRNDIPDTIEQMLACIRLLGGRHGEMPDGIVVDGAKLNDGFDLTESFTAGINGACAISALKCNGTSTIDDRAISERWPSFKKILDSVCT